MPERPSQQFTLPISKQEVVMHTYLTRGERKIITRLALDSGMTISGEIEKVDPSKMFEIQETQFKLAIVSLDGKPIGDESLDGLPEADIDFLSEKIDEFNPKKKSTEASNKLSSTIEKLREKSST